MTGFTRINGHLMVDGIAVADIAKQFGTPLYIYSAAAITASFTRFKQAVSQVDNHVHFALKANSNLAVLRLIARLGGGGDIVSGGEMRRALAAGIPPEKIIFSGVGKTESEIHDALTAGLGQINAESEAEVETVIRIATETNLKTRLALRVNPDVDAETHAKITTGTGDTKFGISMAACPALYRRITEDPMVEAAGLAVHLGSQIMNLAPFKEAWTSLLDLVETLRKDGLNVPNLDLGGGVGVDYSTGVTADIDAFGALVTRMFSNRNLDLGFEPGRFITAEAGVLAVQVIITKDNGAKQFVVVDGAMNDLLRPTLYDAYHRIEPVANLGADAITADIVGPICETGDFFGFDRKLPALSSGDLLAVRSAGAYGAVMRSSYNTRPPAAEVLVLDGTAHLVSKRQTVDELLALDIMPKELT
jgi:diaminopimelate decarboxylase